MKAEPRTAVVTGASSGIGQEAAIALAAQGWHVIAHGRDPERTAAAEVRIRDAAGPGAKVDMIRGDLALLSDAARVADEIRELTPRVDVLLNNAGGVRDQRLLTPEGNEATFAGNHLGHFLLTRRLTSLLQAAATLGDSGPVRVVNVSSRAHQMCTAINWDDLQQIGEWVSVKAYALAKLCNILFTTALSRRLSPSGIVVHAMHPGVVASNFANHAAPEMRSYLASADSVSPAAGADTLLWLATAEAPGTTTGLYYHERQAVAPAALATDEATAERLWAESEALVAKAGF